MPRLFVAVDVPDDLRDRIEREVVDPLRPEVPDARWTRPEGRHLTLKFLGNVDEERVEELSGLLERAASGHAPFEAGFAALGGFPNVRRPRVLWVGVGEGAEPMAELAGSVDEAVSELGFDREKRPFHGHLTLARFKRPGPIGELPEVPVPDERFAVDEIVLFESKLHPKGARYSVRRTMPLG